MDEANKGGPEIESTTEPLFHEIRSLKELVYTRIRALEKAVEVAHEDLVRVPTEVQKAVGTLKDLHEAKIEGNRRECATQFKMVATASDQLQALIETRLDGNDTAIRLLQDTTDKFPQRIDEKIFALEKVAQEKFASIVTQFAERDVRTEQATTSTKTAVDAALAAQEKAVGKQNDSFTAATQKSEDAFTKQIDQLGLLIQTTARGIDDKIDDLKQRVTRIEGMGVGAITAQTTQAVVKTAEQASNSYIVAIVGAIIAAIGLAAGIIIAMR